MISSISHLGNADATAQRGAFTMDTPFKRGSIKETPITRMLGHAINSPQLARLKTSDGPSKVMIRANNLASLTAAMLLNLKPEKREAALIELGGMNYTQNILAFAKNYPGAIGISDAIRFSCALHFLLGIVDAEAGRSTFYSEGYLKFARFFKQAQARRSGKDTGFEKPTTGPKQGLGGLGLHPVLAFEAFVKDGETPQQAMDRARARAASWDAWCYQNSGETYNPAKLNACLNPGLVCDGHHPDSGEGRRCRGMNDGWVKPPPAGVNFPAPPNSRSIVDYSAFQAAACGDLLAPLLTRQQDKGWGIRFHFNVIFGRYPSPTEEQYYGMSRWCAGRNTTDEAMKAFMVRIRNAIVNGQVANTTPAPAEGGVVTPYDFAFRDVGTDFGDGLAKAADAAFDFLGKTADFIADILCRGFKALFGPAVGGVMCDVITFLTRMMTAGVAAIIDIVIESLKGTFEFIRLMIAGKLEEAFMALMQSMGRTLFSLAAPMMVPILMADKGQGRSMSQAFAELKVRADRVVKKQPLWPIMVVMAVVAVITAGVSGAILAPPFTALTGLIIALAPMAATFISEPLKLNVIELRDETLESIEAGIEKFIKFALLIFQGAMAIKDLIPKLRGQLAEFFKKSSAKSLTGGDAATGTQRVKYVIEKFSAGITAVTNAFKNFNVKDIAASAGPLLLLIPDLLLAILPDDAAKAMPSLTEWREAVVASQNQVGDVEKTLKAGATEIFKTFSLGAQVSWMQEAAKEPQLQQPHAAAAIAAPVVAQQFKNKASYPQFVAAFRAELLKA